MPFPLKRVSLNIPLQRVKQLLEEDAELEHMGAADMEQMVEATVLACLHIAFHHLNLLQVPLGAHPYLVESVRCAIQVEDVITPLTFLDYFVEELNSMLVCKRKDMGTEARLIIEMLYYRIEVLKYQPSVVAAAAVLACISNLPG
ncbi:hypothetical protein ACH5RR_038161 [Cinchona calisaya]|uniref:Cyclin C-terminal domain-containing protein n=1 Tax=Cinchona calisaya TaxID=153742 RepID=A0ABD2Y8C6_9GENT